MNRLNRVPAGGNIKRALVLSMFTLAWGILGGGAPAQGAPTFTDPGFVSETIATLPPFTPVGLAFAPDGRIFVWQKSGIVRIIKDGVLLPAPFLDIESQVNQYGDRGLLGLAIDPNLSTTGHVYLLYTHETGPDSNDSGPKSSRLTRVTADPADPDRALAGSEVVILDNLPSDDSSHSIGTVRFAPDGNLFVGVGDGASFNFVDDKALRAQDLNSVNGKILRITTSGAALPDNPFYDGTDSVRSKVWAYGLRNPYRFGLHPSTGEPTIGDVGWNDWEELNRGRGANFGWPCYEGNDPQPLYQASFAQCQALSASEWTPPLFTYPHAGSNAVVGGAYYSATQYPAMYRGNFFFADYVPDWIHRAVFDANDNLVSIEPFADNLGGAVSVELGPDGFLYYVSIITGEVGRVRFSGPLARASATPTAGYSPLSVNFSSAGSVDPNGGALTYLWTFGDGGTSTSANPSHTYTSGGVTTFTATLTVSDSGGQTSTDRVAITVGSQPPTATITSPADGTNVTVGSTVTFQGAATDPDDGALPPSGLSWTVLLHHDSHVHPHQTASGSSGSFVVENYGVGTFAYEVILTATDSSGLTDRAQILLPVVPAPLIGVNPTTINLTGRTGGSAVSRAVTVSNDGNTGSTLNWTASPDQPWLTVSPPSGTAPGTVTVSALPASLLPGTYAGTMTLTAPDAGNSPLIIPVTFVVGARFDFTYPDRNALVADGWDFLARTAAGGIRDTEQTGTLAISYDQTAHPGTIRIPLGPGEIWQGLNDSQNTLFRDLPSGWTSVRLKIAAFDPVVNAQQVGLLAYQDDDNYVNLNRAYIDGGQIELFREQGQATTLENRQTLSNSGSLVLRLDRNASTDTYTGYYSTDDGATWVTVGNATLAMTAPRLAIQVGSNPGELIPADLAWLEIVGPGTLTVTGVSPSTGNPGQSLAVAVTGTDFVSGATCGFGPDIAVTACTVGSATQLTASLNIATEAALGGRSVTVTNPDGRSAVLANGFTVVGASGGSGHWDFVYPDRNALIVDGWDFLARTAAGGTRDTEQTGTLAISYDQTAHPGTIRIPLGPGEIWQGLNDSQNTLFRDLPSGWTSVRLKIAAFDPVANTQQVGLLAYQDDDNYVNLNRAYIDGGQIELFREQGQATTLENRQTLSNSGNLVLRLDRDAASNTYTGYYSTNDGATWVTLGNTTVALSGPRLAIQVGANAAGTTPVADLAWVEIVGAGGSPAPTLTGVSPASGSPGQNLNVVLTGTDFVSGATCGFGADITVTACTVESATQLTASLSIATGATVGSRTVTVANPDGQSASVIDGFSVTTIVSAPTVTGVSPSAGNPGRSLMVAVTGTEFVSGATCGFGADIVVTACTVGSATQLTASLNIATGATLGGRSVTVTNPDGQSGSLANGFTVVAAPGGSGHFDFVYPDRAMLVANAWDFLARTAAGGTRNTEQTGSLAISYDQTAHPGTIRIPLGSGEIWQGLNDSQNTLFRDLPGDWTSVRLKIAAFNPVANFQQVGLLAYQDDDNYVNLNRAYIDGGQIELFREQGQVTTRANRQALSNSGNLVLRLDRDAASNTYAGYYSTNDGATWVAVGNTIATLANPRVGIQVGANLAGTTPVTDLAWVEIVRPVPVSPGTLSFTAIQAGASPAPQALSVTDGGAGTMDWAASANQPWISLSPASGSGSSAITVAVSSSGLVAGTYSGAITVTPSGSLYSPKTIAVALTVTAPPSLSLNATGLDFSGVQSGPSPAAQTLTVANAGGGAMTWSASVSQPWLSLSQDSGTALSSVAVNASTAGLLAGTYTASITVTAAGAANSPQTVGVTLIVDPPAPGLQASPMSLNFGAIDGGANPGPQTVTVTNVAPGSLSWSAVGSQPWITVAPLSGTTPDAFAVSVSSNGLVPGSYSGAVTVTSAGAINSPLTVPVTLTVISDQPGRRSLAYASRSALLADGWDFFARTSSGAPRDTEQTTGLVVDYDQAAHPGTLRVPADRGTTWGAANDTRNALFRDLPTDWQSIRLKLASFAPTGVYQSACLVAYQNDDNYVTLCRDFVNAQLVEWWQETSGGPSVLGNLSNAATTNVVLRLDRNPATDLITAFVSTDGGGSWTQVPGSVVKSLAAPRLGIMVGGNASASVPSADLEFVEVVSPLSPPALGTNPSSLAFGGTVSGPAPGSQILVVTNTGAGDLTWSASVNQPWMTLTPATGSAPGIITVNVSTTGLSAGSYDAVVSLTSPEASNSPRSVPVTLTLALPALIASPTGLGFNAEQGGGAPGPQVLTLSNVAGSPLSWTAAVDQPWLSVDSTSGTAPGSLTVSASSAGLAAGTYNATITFTAAEATNSPLAVPVTLVVSPPAETTLIDLGYASRSALLAGGWDFFARTSSGAPRDTEQATGLVVDYNQSAHPGTLRIPADQGTAWSANNDTRNAVFRDLPAGWQSIRLKVASFAPSGVYQSACVAAYQNDDNYVTLCRDFVGTQLFEWWQETSGGPSILGNLSSSATANIVLRLDRDPTTDLITAFVSTDSGGTWTQVPGGVVKSLAAPRLGILVGGNASASVPNADLDWAEIVAVPPIPAPPMLEQSPGSLSFNTMAGGGDPPAQSLIVGGNGFTWSASVNQPWISISPASGPSSSSLMVSVSTNGLGAGNYSGAVTVTSAEASNSPQIVPVNLSIGSLLDRRLITAAVLVNGGNPSGYNVSPVAPGEFQRYPERYLEHLQVPYETIDVSTTLPPADLFDRQIIIAGHRGLNLNRAWQDAITNAVARGTGFLNLDWDPAVGAQSHIQTVFGATGARAGAPGQAVTIPAAVVPGGSAPHYIAALQKRFLGDPTGDITYVFHPDEQDVQQSVQSTVLTGSAGAVIARIGDDPLIVATAYGSGRAVHVGSLEYLKADRFGFLQGVDDLFWRSLVWAARKPFIVRGYPKLWAVQMDDTTPNWGFRVRDLYDPALTGPVDPDGTGGPWKVTGFVYTQYLPPGSPERGAVRTDIGAGRLEVAPHSFFGTSFGDIYWNGDNGALTDAQWENNVNDVLAWAQGLGGSDALPLSRSLVAHYWDLSDNTGWDLWNQLGFRYLTSIQKPGFQRLSEYNGQERFNARPFWVYEKPPKLVPDENHPFFFADDVTVGSRAGLPAQNMFLFTTQVQGIGAPRPDVTWPDVDGPSGTPWSVQQSVNQFQLYTWRLWSSMAPVQVFTHDSINYELATLSNRQTVIRDVSTWLNANGVRHQFMDDFGDYVYARTKSSLSRSELTGGNITHLFTGNAATADGALIDTELQLYLGDDEGTAVAIPGFSGGRLITLPVGGP